MKCEILVINYVLKTGTHQFDLCCTSTALLRPFYFDLFTSTFSQIWTSYWLRSTGRSKEVEVKFDQKSRSKVLVEVKSVRRSTEKVEYMKIVEVHKRSN